MIMNLKRAHKMTTFVYLRVSTNHQADSGLGLLAQKENCLNFARTNLKDDKDIRIYSDEGVSGTLDVWKRPALMEILEEITEGDVLLSYDGSRLARDTFVWLTIEREIQKKKAKISLACGANGDSLEVQLVRRLLSQINDYSVRKTRERTSMALQAKIREGYKLGRAAYGFKISDCRKELIEVEEEQKIITFVRNLRAHGSKWKEVVAELNMNGYCNRAGREWTYHNARKVFIKGE
jgi:site-specific DNA recombinase